jgi:glycerophosphoryl diester phosphodiesterase
MVERIHQAGGWVYVWTVDDLVQIHRLRAMKVDGSASNRPDLFAHV